MAVEVVLYAVPLRSGTALVATDLTLRALRGAGAVVARRPQPLRVAVLAPAAVVDPAVLAEVPALLRRAATSAALPEANPRRDGGGALPLQSRRALSIFGALLVLAAGESWAQVVAGLWLVVAFPLFLRAQGAARLRTPASLAGGLALAVSAPSVVVHRHAGLAMLAESLTQRGTNDDTHSYPVLARACRQSGVPQLATLYDALASGERAALVFTAIMHGASPTATLDLSSEVTQAGARVQVDPIGPTDSATAALEGDKNEHKEASHGLLQQPA